jgi:integrase
MVAYDDETARAIRLYGRYRRAHRYRDLPRLWIGEQGRLTGEGIDRMLRRRARRAGVEGVHAHRFRHTFADNWLSDGGSEMTLMAIAGWTNPSMLKRYTDARAADRALASTNGCGSDDPVTTVIVAAPGDEGRQPDNCPC